MVTTCKGYTDSEFGDAPGAESESSMPIRPQPRSILPARSQATSGSIGSHKPPISSVSSKTSTTGGGHLESGGVNKKRRTKLTADERQEAARKRKVSNRVHSENSRQRQKDRLDRLKAEVKRLQAENEMLKGTSARSTKDSEEPEAARTKLVICLRELQLTPVKI